MLSTIPAEAKLLAWYSPGLGAYRRPGQGDTRKVQAHLLTQFEWLPLYGFADVPAPAGWVLRSYFSTTEDAFYASHRTLSAKTAAQVGLVEMYAPPGTAGNDRSGHVPPKE